MRDSKRLTAVAVAKMTKPGRYGDGHGLCLQVSRWGTKSWLFRYERGSRERQMGLGPLHTLSLAEAREKARECRKLLLEGIDPLEARRKIRTEARLEALRGHHG
ncbi:MAG TPA: Arm DNA-binding domain-containing protein [Propylenella sp.]|nr:Arm DNA-binding domain-containing protein [Propylenella sp.]